MTDRHQIIEPRSSKTTKPKQKRNKTKQKQTNEQQQQKKNHLGILSSSYRKPSTKKILPEGLFIFNRGE